MKYEVIITETLRRRIYVEAENAEKAKAYVEEQYWDGDIVLDASDYVDTKFEADFVFQL